ncbi:MAG: HD domain-containing protein [Candidatus Omnitrophica bacterium]|nr:HD domain-containing protein [Candidatus Omnitrophota bacterium]
MKEKIESAFRDLISALQVARLYPDWHPQFKKSVEKAYSSIREVLEEKKELVIGIVGEELAFEKEIFFDLSRNVRPAILYLKQRGIERIEILREFNQEELSEFISFLVAPKEELKKEAQEELALRGVKNISAGKIRVSSGTAADIQVEKAISHLSIYEESLKTVGESLEAILNEKEIDRLGLQLAVTGVMENLLGRYQELLNFATLKRYDLKTFSHLLNVSILSMYFSSRLGFAKDEMLDVGIAALFHDIGKSYISRKVIRKPGRLTEEEFTVIKSHALLGAEIMLKYTGSLGILPVVVCFEHHIKYDLSGYPKTHFYGRPHIASLVVSTCDYYDALSQRRGYKADYPPEIVYGMMQREKGATFDPVLLDEFFKLIGVWPVGTLVALSDGRIGVVREENDDDPFRPTIEVIAPADKRERIDLKGQKDGLKIEHSLNPLTEGKDYLALI